MDYETIQVRVDGRVGRVSLNRPQVRNAFNAPMIDEIRGAFAELAKDTRVRAVVLDGHGPSFSAGADVNWMRASLDFTERENLEDARRMSDMFDAIDSFPKPIVCRVHGAALGGGMGLMAVSDIVVAAHDSVFGFTEAKLGILPAVISRFVIPKIGQSWARALYMTAERFGPEVAQQLGLVHWIAQPEQLDDVVDEKVRELLTSGPQAVQEAKKLIQACIQLPPPELRDETARWIAERRSSDEGQEGLRAFLERREPSWRRDG